ncbi:GntR family transcriptional regulator [Aquabacter cavernae]|uniref:GntR family transcriptional regulator n=1 Tax=Aquabacter cavernae TaxID=2496029 RepID=UPI000F8E106F|nr:GntR family transcriptional regulator [Aquabacter cavernae]
METPLVTQLAAQIVDHMKAERIEPGTQLVERKLAEQFRVSRSPVRRALTLLEQSGHVAANPSRGGFTVCAFAMDAAAPPKPLAWDEDETAYLKIAEDNLEGRLPDKVTDSKLARDYGLSSAQLRRVLARIANEGWIERLPGHGWAFLPMLKSMQSYQDSYRFRLAIEPAAIMEPGFVLNRAALIACRMQQQELVDGRIWEVSNPTLFDLNRNVHEAIIACSRNVFFIDSLKRVDRLRRLIEYKQSLDRQYAAVRCSEHVQLIDLLLAERREDAAVFMRRHLTSVSIEKMIERAPRG